MISLYEETNIIWEHTWNTIKENSIISAGNDIQITSNVRELLIEEGGESLIKISDIKKKPIIPYHPKFKFTKFLLIKLENLIP